MEIALHFCQFFELGSSGSQWVRACGSWGYATLRSFARIRANIGELNPRERMTTLSSTCGVFKKKQTIFADVSNSSIVSEQPYHLQSSAIGCAGEICAKENNLLHDLVSSCRRYLSKSMNLNWALLCASSFLLTKIPDTFSVSTNGDALNA